MKLRLGLFSTGLLIIAVATMALIDIMTRNPLFGREGAGGAVAWILIGLGIGIGIPLILGRRKPSQ